MLNKKTWQLSAAFAAGCVLLGTFPAFAESPVVHKNSFVRDEVAHDVSLPVRDYPNVVTPQFGTRLAAPNPMNPLNRPLDLNSGPIQPNQSVPPAAVLQKKLSIDGIGSTGFAPPDTNAGVGTTQLVETVNTSYAVYDKTTGSIIQATKAISTIFTGFGNRCKGSNFSDPVVNWDKLAQRWVVSILAGSDPFFSSTSMCYAVSTTADATGSYNRYEFDFGNSTADYPKTGVWPDGYYLSVDIFNPGYAGIELCALDRSAMLAGTTAKSVCFGPMGAATDFAVLPGDMDGTNPPPAGAPNPMMEAGFSPNIVQYNFHVDFVNTANSTLTGPISIVVPNWTFICSSRSCIPQPSPGEGLDALSDRLMYRLAYRNFGDHESIVAVHTVKPTQGSAVGASRWYEFRATPPGSAYKLFQNGTFQNASISYWLGSIAMDKKGNIVLGVNASSSSLDPSIRVAARNPTDPKGMLSAPVNLVAGTGVQTSTSNRWGDYASMQVDPTDDCTFYYAGEYIKTTGSFRWSTRLGAFKVQGCQ